MSANKLEHTPGVWTAEPYAWDARGKPTAWTVNTDAVPELDAEGHLQNVVFDGVKNEADAHLGAAARELLEALEAVLFATEPLEKEGRIGRGDFERASAALAKARGTP